MHHMYQIVEKRHFQAIVSSIACILLILTALAGCNTTPVTEKAQARPPVFYPPLPNPPRIQYLNTYSSQADLRLPVSGFLDFILGKEKENAGVAKPYGAAIYDGKIYVIDTRGPGYAVFDLVGRKYKLVSGSGGGQMQKPINIAIDKKGTKFVTDTGRLQVLAYDANDRFLRAYGKEGEFKPAGIVVDDDNLYVTDLQKQQVIIINKLTGNVQTRFGQAGSKSGELFFPTNIAIGPNKNLYIADTGNYRIEEYSTKGEYLNSYGSVGISLGKFARPKGVALDRDSRMYVVDAAFENVQLLNKTGNLLLFFGSPGDAPENINLPTTIFIDYDNVALFKSYADPGFKIEYLILVASQFGPNKVNVFGFGKMEGMEYPDDLTIEPVKLKADDKELPSFSAGDKQNVQDK
jgi:sugar lactone lactonase YvrE